MRIALHVRTVGSDTPGTMVPLTVRPFKHFHDRHLPDAEAVAALTERTEVAPWTFGLDAITHDAFGVFYLGKEKLSKHIWVRSSKSNKECRVEPLVDDVVPEALPRRSLVRTALDFLAGRRCGTCRFFDHEEGLKWRHQVTHVFLDGTSLAMWDAILATTSQQHKQVAIPDDNIGLCPIKQRIVARGAPPCEEFIR